MLLQLYLNGRPLVLRAGTELQMDQEDTLLTDTAIAADISFPITLPCDGNEIALGHIDILELRTRTVKLDGLLVYYDGINVTGGKLVIIGYDEVSRSFEASVFVVGLLSDYATKKLKDLPFPALDWGADITAICVTATDINTKLFPEVPCCFPMTICVEFYEGQDHRQLVNHTPTGAFQALPYGATAVKSSRTPMVPCFYALYVLEALFDHYGYTLAGDWHLNDQVRRLYLWNNRPLDAPHDENWVLVATLTERHYELTGPSANKMFFSAQWPPNRDPMGIIDHQEGTLTFRTEGYYDIEVDLEITLVGPVTNYLWLRHLDGAGGGTEQQVNIGGLTETFFGSGIWRAEMAFTIHVGPGGVCRPLHLDIDQSSRDDFDILAAQIRVSPPYPIPAEPNAPDLLVRPQNHMPDMTLRDYLDDLKRWYGLEVTLDTASRIAYLNIAKNTATITASKATDLTPYVASKLSMEFLEANADETGATLGVSLDAEENVDAETLEHLVYLGEYDTFADLPTALDHLGKYATTRDTLKVYLSKFIDCNDPGWEPLGWYYPDVVVGNGAKEIRPVLSPLVMDRVTLNYRFGKDAFDAAYDQDWFLPRSFDAVQDPRKPGALVQPRPRMAFYWGIKTMNSQDNGFGGSSDRGPAGETLGPTILAMHSATGSVGHYDAYWKDVLEAFNSGDNEKVMMDLRVTHEFLMNLAKNRTFIYRNQILRLLKPNLTFGRDCMRCDQAEFLRMKL